MGENHHHHHQATTSRLGARNTGGRGGEIVEVQGGHIVRSTGRKDRHSKVCTAKGPRDRRVRLAAHTAIQFYDVQDRLGYDRPSKAVDWLIKKAKSAIDELAELPAWTPTATATNNPKSTAQQDQISDERDYNLTMVENFDALGGSGGGRTENMEEQQQQQQQQRQNHLNPDNNSSFLPPSLDSDAIADTIKSFFPICASVETSSSSIHLESYPPDFLSRTSSQNQDLRLSLQSLQEPILLQHHHHHHHHHSQNEHHHGLFSGNGHPGYYGPFAGWSEQHQQHHPAEISRFQRMLAWNTTGAADTGNGGASGDSGGGGAGGGFMFNSSSLPQSVSPPPPLQPLFGQNQFFTQRGPLQSSNNTPSIRAWIDPSIASSDHHHLHHNNNDTHHIPQIHHQQSAIVGVGFAASSGGFRVPARIQGDEEEHVHGGIHNKPTSASSNSRH